MIEISEADANRAREAGERHARAEIALDILFPHDPIDGEEDIRSLAFSVLGEKIDPNSEPAAILAAAYEEGYWEVWDFE